MSISYYKLKDANSKAYPFYYTAYNTIYLSFLNYSDTYSKANPF